MLRCFTSKGVAVRGARPRGKSAGRPSHNRPERLRLEPLEPRLALDSTLVFNEIMYNPPGDTDDTLEWIELHNQLAVDVDLSGWSITSGVRFDFAQGTIVPGHGLLVVAKSPQALEASGSFAGALGPFAGQLSNGGEELRLVNNDGRVMNVLDYRDDGRWPVAADGAGASLAKRNPYSSSGPPQSWTFSPELGGTPGAINFPTSFTPLGTRTAMPIDVLWRYDASGTDLGTAWREPEFVDDAWDTVRSPFSRVVISEAGPGDPDFIEIQNVSGAAVDTAGWVAAVNNAFDVGQPADVNAFHATLWNLPDSMAPDEVRYRSDVEDGSGNYWGENIFWRTSGPGWAILLDEAGGVVDFVVWGYDADDLAAFDLTIGGHHVTAEGIWNGDPMPSDAASSRSFQRSGAIDGNDLADWAVVEETIGEQNADLTVPFTSAGLELDPGRTTYYFRAEFDYGELPSQTELMIDSIVDDGAVFYLNGLEVHRRNMPPGPVSYHTLALSEVVSPSYSGDVAITAFSLQQGRNVLAVEVHQVVADDVDMRLGAEVSATLWPPRWGRGNIDMSFNEIAAAGRPTFRLELANHGSDPIDLDGYVIRGPGGAEHVLPAGVLPAGGLISVDDAQLGFRPMAGDRLSLISPDRSLMVDAMRVDTLLQGRSPDGTGPWLYADVETPGAANHFDLHDEIVINEIMYHHHPWTNDPAQPYLESTEEWIELYNRGTAQVDLGGWELDGGIGYDFLPGTTIAPGGYLVVAKDADALRLKYPDIEIVGNYSRWLSDRGERIVLIDAVGNPADEVHYFDFGRWPAYADGGGSSLELIDPDADNSKPEAWAASDERAKTVWQTVTYRGPATNFFGPTRYNELVLGLLDMGEVLLDEVSVVEDPEGSARQLIQNGTFRGDAVGGPADRWRIIGNHGTSLVAVDPADPGNRVLRMVASGPTEHMHNHAETTLKYGNTFVTINSGLEYEISYRARWQGGSPQLNSRLYFNRLARTTVLEVPPLTGTPGAENSTYLSNVGPTYADLSHTPAVPEASAEIDVSVYAEDPDGVDGVTLHWSVDGGPSGSLSMTREPSGRYTAAIPGQAAGTVVQFYVQGRDALGAESAFPAGGVQSRALLQVDDGRQSTIDVHDFRIVMTTADANLLHTSTNVMSNGRIGATVVLDQSEVYYDVGIRLKGSERGRDRSVRVGFNVRFDPTALFLGVHETVGIDRSGAGDQYSQKEILVKHTINHAGDLVSMYDDLVHVITPRSAHTGSAMLQMARYNDVFLGSHFTDGERGRLFEYELIYYPTSTTGGVEGLKRPLPDQVMGVSLGYRGDDKENYRWNFLIKNQRDADDYSTLIPALSAIGLPSGPQFHQQTQQLLDVDQWLRSFAVQTLWGIGDNYTTGAQHNAMFYTRPEDGKTLFLPWDMDFTGSASATSGMVRNGDLSKLLTSPSNLRAYYGHVLDVVTTTFNSAYLDPWIDHYSDLLPRESLSGFRGYVSTRSGYALNAARTAVPAIAFQITTNSGNPFSVDDVAVTIEGNGWIDVREIYSAGTTRPLEVTWTDRDRWQVTVPLAPGDNELSFQALDFQGNPVGTDAITVTSTVPDRPLQESLRIAELNYNPADPTPEERAAGFANNDDFEFVELRNVSQRVLNLQGVQFTGGIGFTLDAGGVQTLGPHGSLVIAADPAAFQARYGQGIDVAGRYDRRLDNGGERVTLVDAAGGVIADFRYGDSNDPGWPGRADGKGASLELISPAEVPITEPQRTGFLQDPGNWRSSGEYGGTPGTDGAGLLGDVVIGEVLTNTAAPDELDAIELYNTTDREIDVGGWYLSHDWGWDPSGLDGNYRRFRVPDDTTMAALGYLVFDEDDFNPGRGTLATDFSLEGVRGGDLWLMEADADGKLTRFVDHLEFGPASAGESWGRHPNAQGLLYPMEEVTLGGPNTGPRVGPLVISELMYRPPDPDGPGGIDPDDLEYVEICNPTGQSVPLTDWHFDGGVDFDFAAGSQIGPGAVLVLLPFDPYDPASAGKWSDFAGFYGLDENDKAGFTGGYTHWLDDDGEAVRLQRPGYDSPEGPGVVVRLLEDEVRYLAAAPWAAAPWPDAAGNGLSLSRTAAEAWGNDPASWQAAQPDPGFFPIGARVVGRHVFYNNSAFDGNDPSADARDDAAVAPDKRALLPGGTATFANYTSFSRGLSGIMIDFAGLPQGDSLDADDFRFRVGNDDDPGSWAQPQARPNVTVRRGDGTDGSDRVTLVWDEGAIGNQWLQVTVLAGATTGLSRPDVFYFGNAIGESGNSTTDAKVSVADMIGARDNYRGLLDPAPIDFNFDYDRDARVKAADMLIARDNQTHFLNALRLIHASRPPRALPPAAAAGRPAAGDSVAGGARAGGPSWLEQLDPAGVSGRTARRGPSWGVFDQRLDTR